MGDRMRDPRGLLVSVDVGPAVGCLEEHDVDLPVVVDVVAPIDPGPGLLAPTAS
jgi:hypothetical protein